MSYFTTLLSSQAHTLRLPSQSKDDIERYTLQHQKGNVSPEHAPFRRQLDFWAFAIASAIADGTPPLEDPPASWGRKFADTRSVQMPDGLCEMLAVIALTTLGPDHEGTDDPAQIIELGNRFAGAGCPKLLNQLSDPNLRATALDKALEFARTLRSEGKRPGATASESSCMIELQRATKCPAFLLRTVQSDISQRRGCQQDEPLPPARGRHEMNEASAERAKEMGA